MIMKSTSIHNLNADKGLGLLYKPPYLFLNWLNNLWPYYNLDKRIRFVQWQGDWVGHWAKVYRESSAGRKISDLFWRTLPWRQIKSDLGGINIFDTGCGSGSYGLLINDASEKSVTSYTGVDAKRKPVWAETQAKYHNFKFIESNSSNISSLIPQDTNFFITQSAIEHFEEDLTFFKQIKDFIDKSHQPVMQVHIFPAAAALPLYLFHGLRQYTPRNVSKITRLFGNNSEMELYGLGGVASRKLHWRYFTWPILFLRRPGKWKENLEKYDRELKRAVGYDVEHPVRSPLFWALVIRSNFK